MTNKCPFCGETVEKINTSRLDLRICPSCFSTFFPSDRTMTFRTEIFHTTRKLWLEAIKGKENPPINEFAPRCIDHQVPLVKGKLPDYGIDGYIPTCCHLFHLSCENTKEILARTLEGIAPSKPKKHHFAIIRFLDKIISKFVGEKEDDSFDTIQYELHFKKILEAKQ